MSEEENGYSEIPDEQIGLDFSLITPYAVCLQRNGKKYEKIWESVATLVSGFPGIGLVGSIASRHIAFELGMEVIGYLRSPLIPPQATFFDGALAYPYRFYGKEGLDIAVLVAESPISDRAHYYIASSLLEFVQHTGTKEVIVFDGYGATSENDSILLIAEPNLWERIATIAEIDAALGQDSKKSEKLGTGFIGGLPGAILNEGMVNTKVDCFALLVPVTNPRLPAPGAAARLIEVLNSYKRVSIDVEGLLQHARKIEQNFKELARRQEKMQIADRTRKDTGLYY